MSNITKPIVRREWELIRDRIGLILAEELATQAQLDYDDVLFELPDVYIERYVPFNHSEMPAINVMVAQGDYTQETQQSQDGTWVFYVDAYCTAKDADGQRGDQYASLRLHRLIGMCQAIIMDSRFKTLLFEPGSISNRTVKGIMMADPTKAMEATNSVMARMTIEVRCTDDVELVDDIPLAEYVTVTKMNNTALGYLWGGTTSFTPPTTCSDAELNVNGVFLANIPSGEEFNLIVIDTLGNPVGDAYGNMVIVPAAVANVTFNGVPVTPTSSGGGKNVTVQTASGGLLGTVITDTADDLVIEVADQRNTATPMQSGQTSSFRAKDDGALKFGRLTDWWNLPYTNYFNHSKRFTGIYGGYQDETTGNYFDKNGNASDRASEFPEEIVIDWGQWSVGDSEVICYMNAAYASSFGSFAKGTDDWDGWIDGQPYTDGQSWFSDWYMWNVAQGNNIINYEMPEGNPFGEKPFNSPVVSLSTTLYTSTTRTGVGTQAYIALSTSLPGFTTNLKTSSRSTFLVRNITLTEIQNLQP